MAVSGGGYRASLYGAVSLLKRIKCAYAHEVCRA